jgi:hypothetical protein
VESKKGTGTIRKWSQSHFSVSEKPERAGGTEQGPSPRAATWASGASTTGQLVPKADRLQICLFAFHFANNRSQRGDSDRGPIVARSGRDPLGDGWSEYDGGDPRQDPFTDRLELFFALQISSKSSHQISAERAAFGLLGGGVLEVLPDF